MKTNSWFGIYSTHPTPLKLQKICYLKVHKPEKTEREGFRLEGFLRQLRGGIYFLIERHLSQRAKDEKYKKKNRSSYLTAFLYSSLEAKEIRQIHVKIFSQSLEITASGEKTPNNLLKMNLFYSLNLSLTLSSLSPTHPPPNEYKRKFRCAAFIRMNVISH